MLHAALASGPCRRPVTGPRAVPPGETHSHSRRAGATRARDDLAERCSRRSRCGHGAWPIHGDGTRVEPPICTVVYSIAVAVGAVPKDRSVFHLVLGGPPLGFRTGAGVEPCRSRE